MDRIQINGVWYVREDVTPKKIELELYEHRTMGFENSDVLFEATKFYKDNSEEFYDGFDIKYVNKKTNAEEIWDNVKWIEGVYENNPESLEEISYIDENIKSILKEFLKKLKVKGWF